VPEATAGFPFCFMLDALAPPRLSTNVMHKSGSAYLVVALALLLLAMFIFLPWGAGPGALPREMGFWVPLQNSLNHLDQAKWKWMEERHKTEGDTPTMEDLAPYLGDWTNSIRHLVALGVEYKITPLSEEKHQSDVATLSRDLRFQIGFCRYYRAGTKFSIHGDRFWPLYDTKSSLIAFYQNNRGLVVLALFTLAIGNLLVFVVKKIHNVRLTRVTHEHQNA
jgi:hypothetical protein